MRELDNIGLAFCNLMDEAQELIGRMKVREQQLNAK